LKDWSKELTVLLPAKDEEQSIGLVLDEVGEALPGAKVLVIDNHSSNGTAKLAYECGARVIYEGNTGKGLAVREGLRHVDTPYVIMMNSDYTYPAGYARLVGQILVDGRPQVDAVLGYRALIEKGSMHSVNRFGNWGLSLLASALYGKRVYDICSGMWGFRTEVLRKYNLTSRGFTLEADLFVNTVQGKYRLEQVPIAYRKRLDGSKTKLRVRDGFRIGWFLIKRRFTRTSE